MMETISHYNANGCNVYALMLYASKVFDRCNYGKLLRVLLKRKVSLLVLRLLMCMYTKQQRPVRWGCNISSQFIACSGVKQGAILYPKLVAVYIDELLENKRIVFRDATWAIIMRVAWYIQMTSQC